ncbi:SAV_2336 N-terminal domain-related protein [Streptomyces sp. WMMC500]|uniref:SAV_2336 N-terminal domain-related protein n=1 Tax=Streptomyces sp. WMMC500 TaxID=3015154 RepID=UPI00248CC3B1|nr:SAV_2336 N-terminal domain-related protein [Streptomyces sp. WMMC500]WBB63169.1 SAV_2336 N-terminal domain-related protein [Streptomyces sp. WMMC500]
MAARGGDGGQEKAEELVGRLLAAGLPPDARGLADVLWLAEELARSAEATGGGDPRAGGARSASRTKSATFPDAADAPEGPGPAPAEGANAADATGAGAHAAPERRVGLAAGPGLSPRTPVRDAVDTPAYRQVGRVGVPEPAALPALVPLQRALRPLRRYQPRVAAVAPGELDEEETAEVSARADLVIPVLRTPRRRATLQLLMDASPAMEVWGRLLEDLRTVAERSGAFRDVTVHRLHPLPDGGVGCTGEPGRPSMLQDAGQLHDPGGQRLTLVLSDCAGPMWRDGRMQRMLHGWLGTAPVAVVQPLPHRRWREMPFAALPGLLVRHPGPYPTLDFRPGTRGDVPPAGARPLPVLAPEPGAVGTWARLLSAGEGLSLPGAAGWVRRSATEAAAVPAAAVRPADVRPDPAATLAAFDATASPAARLLAIHLAAVPLVLPVIRLVQRALFPDTGPAETAEILLSELVVAREPVPGTARDPAREPVGDDPWFDFRPGVRELLLRRLSHGEAALVLKHCSLYIERTFGHGARNFPAVAVAYLSGEDREPELGGGKVPDQFARVSEQVLRAFQPAFRGPATAGGPELLRQYEDTRSVRDLLDAVRALRRAVVEERDTAQQGLLARALLLHWQRLREPDALAEAEQWARSALAADGSGTPAAGGGPPADAPSLRERLTYAEVMWEVARERVADGEHEQAVAALRASATQLRRSRALVTTHAARRERGGLLAEVLRRLHSLTGDDAALHEAEETIDELLAGWPDEELVPARLFLARGRVTLGRAQAEHTVDETRAYGLRAAADLRTGVDLLRMEGGPELRRLECEALLDLAEAHTTAAGDAGAGLALAALDRAGRLAVTLDDYRLQAESLRRKAQVRVAEFGRGGADGLLVEADEWLADALRLLPPGAALYGEVLTEHGELLLRRARLTPDDTGLRGRAVPVLREVLAETPQRHPDLPRRQLLFGRALRLRYEASGTRTDLYEAEWVLDRAAREDDAPARVRAQAWLELGDVQLLLDIRTEFRQRQERAADCYRRAALLAEQAGDPADAARAHHRRGQMLEPTAGRQVALRAYRDAWEQWSRAEQTQSAGAALTREQIRTLEAGD